MGLGVLLQQARSSVADTNSTVSPQFLIVHLSPLGTVVLYLTVGLVCSTIARILWHGPLRKVALWMPESGLLLAIGLLGGVVMHFTGVNAKDVSGEFFFELLLPLIILPAGYFLDAKIFLYGFEFIQILLHAILGTVVSAITIGLVLWVASPIFLAPLPVLQALAFGSLLSATDPVAVLAMFEQAGVNAKLFNLVAGESTLNDAIGITLYGFFVQLASLYPSHDVFPPSAAGWAVLQFLVISFGGLFFGICGGVAASLVSRFSDALGVLEPIMVVTFPLLVFALADWVGISGIIALFACAVMQSFFVDRNLREPSRVGARSLVFLLGQLSETIVFLMVGALTVLYCLQPLAKWDGVLIGITFAIIIPLRFVVVLVINFGCNISLSRSPQLRIPLADSLLQGWSGLRGPVAFMLAIQLPTDFESKSQLISTTLVIIWATLFVIGITTRPLISLLRVELASHEAVEVADPITTIGHWMSRVFIRPLNWEEVRVGRMLRDRSLGNRSIVLNDLNLRRVQEIIDSKVVEQNDILPELHGSSRSNRMIPRTDLKLFDSLDRLPLELCLDIREDDFHSLVVSDLTTRSGKQLNWIGL